jgi:uncharacterized coiled-coil protein SlyX
MTALATVLVLSAVLIGGTKADDNYEQRIADLESRVGELETEVSVLQKAIANDASSETSEESEQVKAIKGIFTLQGHPGGPYQAISHGGASDTTCTGAESYSEVRAGVVVTVTDEAGAIVGTSPLGQGVKTNNTTCVFPFSLEVTEARFYTFSVGNLGEVTYSYEEMEASGWEVSLTIDAR